MSFKYFYISLGKFKKMKKEEIFLNLNYISKNCIDAQLVQHINFKSK